LKGFQRKEIRSHVNGIVEFLDSGPVLFPNAIILALAPEVEFRQSRGPVPDGMTDAANSGTLTIPLRPEGRRAAWIVDGQQRSIALSRAKDPRIPVPVVGFVSGELETHREQFILVNKAKPLPTRLINELLPEVSVLLPRDLSTRRLPSVLCDVLNRDLRSPFHKLVRRASDEGSEKAVVVDTALIRTIERSLKPPFGALSHFRRNGDSADTDAMYANLTRYWSAVREVFPEAWGLPASESRLMHSAGIQAMGALMDQVMLRAETTADVGAAIKAALERIAPHCCWTEGTWEELRWRWNEIESTPQHIKRLTEHLMHLDRELSRRSG
jgi:DGQHR domain-containing protein